MHHSQWNEEEEYDDEKRRFIICIGYSYIRQSARAHVYNMTVVVHGAASWWRCLP